MTAGPPYLAACMTYCEPTRRYLREWIEFHRLVGVERFFLYNNGSTDDYASDVLRALCRAGSWSCTALARARPSSTASFRDCLHRHRDDARWIAFIDIDEFLFSPRGRPVPDILVDYEEFPAVGVNRALFGTSGHVTRPAGLVIESYLYRSWEPGRSGW